MGDKPRLGPPQFDSAGSLFLSEDQRQAAANVIHTILKEGNWLEAEEDDLKQAGWYGYLQAAKSFQPDREIQFSTWAWWRIRGAMQDYRRTVALIRGKRGESPPTILRLDEPTPESRLGVGDENQGSDDGLSRKAFPEFAASGMTAREELLIWETEELIWSTIDTLPSEVTTTGHSSVGPRELITFGMNHDFDLGWQRDAALYYHVTESRISQVFRMSLVKMREILTSQYSSSDFLP